MWHAAWHQQELAYRSVDDIHNREFNPLIKPGRFGKGAEAFIFSDPSVFRLTMLRHPVSRLASAYASKLSWDSGERRKVNMWAGREAGGRLTFADFVAMIHADHEFRDSNGHWRLQARQISYASLAYDFIGLQENLAADLLYVRGRLFPELDTGIFDAGAAFPKTRSDSARIVDGMAPDVLAMIEEAYAEDFLLYERVARARFAQPELAVG